MTDRKTALVTGAAGGIGAALCRNLADRGYRVLAQARSKEKAESVGDYTAVWGDLTQDADVEAIARQVGGHGGADLVVHNAGVLSKDRRVGPHGLGIQGEVNVLAPYALTRALDHAGALREGATVLVNSSSAAGFARSTNYETLFKPDGSSLFGQYALSKAAANALVVQMARALPMLKIVSVEPGFVKTDMTAGNADMPAPMRWLAPLVGSGPDKAARRVLDHVLANDVRSGAVVQGTKVFEDQKWESETAQASIAALLARALPNETGVAA